MEDDAHPVVVAFDGSPEAQEAVRTAARLFRDRPLLVVSVWEPGLAMAAMPPPDAMAMTYPLPSAEDVQTVDRLQRDHAGATAAAGAQMARDLGATAEAMAVPDSVDVAETVSAIADQRDAAAVVVGTRGRGTVRSRLLGSTSRRLLHDTRRPLLIVRAP